MTTARLSILQVLTHSKVNAGGAIQAFLLSRELARLGHRVTMVFSEREDGTRQEVKARVESAGCRYVGMRLRRRASIGELRALLAEGFDVAHLHRELALQRFLQAAPLSMSIGAVANVGTSKIPALARARRLRSRRIDRIVVVAEALKRLLVSAARIDPTHIEVVYGAFDEERFLPDIPPYDREAEFRIDPSGKLIGLIANFDPKKGHKVFVQAAHKILAQRPDCWFLFAGKGDRARLDEMADASGVPRERLIFLGFHEDIPRLVRTLDVSVCASTKGEGLTGTIRESMAMGTPVVSSALAGNVEIVRQRETGLLVPPGDANALADAVLETLAKPDESSQWAARARQLVRERFTSRHRAVQMARLYGEIAEYRKVREMPAETILYPDFQG
ncbi:MAG: glycosyltransferase family 4 protein [Planctomycetota bacterium]